MNNDPNAHYFLNDWLQNRFLTYLLGTTGSGKTYTFFDMVPIMKRYRHTPSHIIICSTSGGLDRTLRKQLKERKITCPQEFCFINDLTEIVQSIISSYIIKKVLEKLLLVQSADLINDVENKLDKLQDDITSKFILFETFQKNLQIFIDNIRECLYKTVKKRILLDNGQSNLNRSGIL
ncbi:hypothetical protein TRFO_24483 [Tritrichomonas foetus]|uniref:Helicase/UvrB N-terminal domain-containing protein n=1 Tax=Tritrichomonas foetus TaxID=1144522 RepID=A0A1J4KCF0_9EUKA|nr:hypothetical protein TRFO_24483 [Tritrichomonas foetus]|eukprot:OHT07326.1 hypothetical protein TRFO_24483 [Tritrichomonas foetus]